jgi:hypothetical protein
MNPRRILATGITASAIAHLSALLLLLFFTEVHPFGSVTAEPITVDIVPAAEAPPAPKIEEPLPESKPSDAFDLPSNSAASASSPPAAPPAAVPPAAAPPPAAPQPAPPRPKPQATKPPPPAQQKANAQPQPQASPQQPAYVPPQPDLSVKYGVMLGLPPDMSAEPSKDKKSGDDFDSPASKTANLASNLIAEFRRHLKTCSKLPASIAPSDNIKITLRVLMTTDGKLAAEPIVVEGTASVKALDLKQSAVEALEACQPYSMLPVDRYGEWKVLDLSFSPQDFG